MQAVVSQLLIDSPQHGLALACEVLTNNEMGFLLGEFGPEHAGIEVHLNVKGINIPVAEAQHLAVILFELLSNSLKHAFHRKANGDGEGHNVAGL